MIICLVFQCNVGRQSFLLWFKLEFVSSFSVLPHSPVADPGKGIGAPGIPLIFRPNRGLRLRETALPPPISQGLDDRPPLSESLVPPLLPVHLSLISNIQSWCQGNRMFISQNELLYFKLSKLLCLVYINCRERK